MEHRKIRTSLDPLLEAPAFEPAPAPRGASLAPSARLEATGAAPEPLEGASEAPARRQRGASEAPGAPCPAPELEKKDQIEP